MDKDILKKALEDLGATCDEGYPMQVLGTSECLKKVVSFLDENDFSCDNDYIGCSQEKENPEIVWICYENDEVSRCGYIAFPEKASKKVFNALLKTA